MSFDCPPWNPETDPVLLALLGKFIEELNEAGHMAARCIVQGVGEVEPVTKLPNRSELEKRNRRRAGMYRTPGGKPSDGPPRYA